MINIGDLSSFMINIGDLGSFMINIGFWAPL